MNAKHSWQIVEILPSEEVARRHTRLRAELARRAPEASGLFVFSRLNIYYLTGTLANGLFWLPLEGEPVLMVRKSLERAPLESPLRHIVPYTSYANVPGILADLGSPLGPVAAAEMMNLPWGMGLNFTQRMPSLRILPGDAAINYCRSIKSPWELEKMRLCGSRHARVLEEELPHRIRPGMTEHEIARIAWELALAAGHSGVMRMAAYGEEGSLLHASAGESGNYPTHYNGPIGAVGVHPSQTGMGYAGTVWKSSQILCLDMGFNLEGYNSDATRTFWSGRPGSAPDEVCRAHDACVELYLKIEAMLKPGTLPEAIWDESLAFMKAAGQSEGFMGLGGNKVPFVGHGIGLNVDEQPVAAARFGQPLEEGMVMALEPKIGLPGLGMVGVENTIEITAAGGRSLSGGQLELCFIDL